MAYSYPDFERFARKLKLDSGKPLRLEDFQKEILRDHFGPALGLTVIVPKKNYKTTTMAAVGLFHLHETKQADVPILASSSKQARTMFRQAQNFVRNSGTQVKGSGYRQLDKKDVFDLDGVEYEIRSGLMEIRANGGLLYVIASDTDHIDGVIPSLAMVDELHRHKNADNYGVLVDGLGPRKARIITISTAGASADSPLGMLRSAAHQYRTRKVDDRHIRYAEGTNVLHEWALLEDEDDPEDLHDVKRVNPAKVNTLTELKRRRKDPLMSRSRWLRFGCGIWTAGENQAITGPEWDRLYADIGQVRDGDAVVLAPSVGHAGAIGIASARDERVAVRAEIVEAREGHSILADVEDRIVELCDRYQVLEVAHPVRSKIRSAELLLGRGVPITEHPDVPVRLAAWTETFDRLMTDGLLIHDGDPVLRSHVLAAEKKVSETGERYMVSEQARALIAVAAAVHVASVPFDDDWEIILPSEGTG